jgi:hypothetical protein
LALIDADLSADLLGDMTGATTLSSVAEALASIPKLDWTWIDFHIGLRLTHATAPGEAGWSASEVWQRACQPWLRWVG